MGRIADASRRALYYNTMMHISDNRRIEIENCKKIIEYNDICVRVKTTSCMVTVWGSGLVVDDFCTGGIIITGKISSIELEKVM